MRTPADIFDNAYTYIFIIFMGIPATILYNLLAGILRSLGDSKTPVVFLALSSFLNIFLDFALILWFDAGWRGRHRYGGIPGDLWCSLPMLTWPKNIPSSA